MELWTHWVNAIHSALVYLSADAGLGLGMAIVALTLILRTIILPISWSSAYRGCVRQKKLLRLQPALQKLKAECGDQPHLYAQRMLVLYREQGISTLDWRSLAASLLQMPFLAGMYQTLRTGVMSARFLWMETLSRPDPYFALLAGLTTMLMLYANPDLPEQMRLLLIVVPSILAALLALKFCSALAVYFTVSNCYSALQTSALHYVVARRLKSGVLVI